MRSDAACNILTLNCGSSSLKYKLIRMPQEEELVSGEAERIGFKTQGTAFIRHSVRGVIREYPGALPDHSQAFRKIIGLLGEDAAADKSLSFRAFAHRYVHPGPGVRRTAAVTAQVMKQLEQNLDMAPLHNPIIFGLMRLCREEFSRVPQFAVFDTAFHSTIPEENAAYALPDKLVRKFKLRRVGFHGISHQYVMQEACRFLERHESTQKMISCHLGSGGSSVCAIEHGRSVNTSMGFTPLEGLVMNTRSGDLDLGVVFDIMAREDISGEDAQDLLVKKSGVLGVFGESSDLRDAVRTMESRPQARAVFDMYVARIRKYVGYYSLLLRKADILVFTDSLGTGLWRVRESVCEGLGCFGIRLDEKVNREYTGGIRDVSAPGSEAAILVVPTNEEIMIARQAYREMNDGHSA